MCGSWDGTGQFFLATTKFRAATAKFLPVAAPYRGRFAGAAAESSRLDESESESESESEFIRRERSRSPGDSLPSGRPVSLRWSSVERQNAIASKLQII